MSHGCNLGVVARSRSCNCILGNLGALHVYLQRPTSPFSSMCVRQAPFLEFIQRVCDTSVHSGDVEEKASEQVSGGAVRNAKAKPGCGGFGIRNFLTLFLSIEVAKALRMREAGVAEGNALKKEAGDKMVAILTEQLNVSNPILTVRGRRLWRMDFGRVPVRPNITQAHNDNADHNNCL